MEAIRALTSARTGAIRARTAAGHQLRALVIAGPADLRGELEHLPAKRLADVCARMRPSTAADPVLAATKTAMRSLARRW